MFALDHGDRMWHILTIVVFCAWGEFLGVFRALSSGRSPGVGYDATILTRVNIDVIHNPLAGVPGGADVTSRPLGNRVLGERHSEAAQSRFMPSWRSGPDRVGTRGWARVRAAVGRVIPNVIVEATHRCRK